MAQIIKFPESRIDNLPPKPPTKLAAVPTRPRNGQRLFLHRLFRGIHMGLWVVVVLTSPLWRWLVLGDLLVQSVRALYYWNLPATHAGLVLLAHGLAVAALAAFIFCEPKGFR